MSKTGRRHPSDVFGNVFCFHQQRTRNYSVLHNSRALPQRTKTPWTDTDQQECSFETQGLLVGLLDSNKRNETTGHLKHVDGNGCSDEVVECKVAVARLEVLGGKPDPKPKGNSVVGRDVNLPTPTRPPSTISSRWQMCVRKQTSTQAFDACGLQLQMRQTRVVSAKKWSSTVSRLQFQLEPSGTY